MTISVSMGWLMSLKLQNAYDTMSDPAKRRSYDTIWTGIRDRLRAKKESDRREADAAEAEKKRATEDKAKKQKEDDAQQERLRRLNVTKSRYDSDIFEVSRVVKKLTADLKRLQDQDDEDSRKERERNSWWAYMTSPIYGKVDETEEQKQARESARLHRLASKSIKGSELRDKEAKLKRLQSALQDVNSQIAVEKQKAEYAASAQVRERKARMEQEARDRAQQEMRERLAKARKENAERAAKEAREAQAAREAREAQEREWKATMAAAAERRSREAEKRRRAIRAAEEAARKAKEAQAEESKPAPSFSGFFDSTDSACQHRKFWAKVEGRHLCSNCLVVQRRFAYKCPGCKKIACASCRQTLRGEKGKSHKPGWGKDYYADFSSSYYDYD